MKKSIKIEFDASVGFATPTGATIELDLVELPEFNELDDGVYQVTVASGVASWTESPVPAMPTEDGNYQLTVASGVLSWTLIT